MLFVELLIGGEWLKTLDVSLLDLFGTVIKQLTQEIHLIHLLLGGTPVVDFSLLSGWVQLLFWWNFKKDHHS